MIAVPAEPVNLQGNRYSALALARAHESGPPSSPRSGTGSSDSPSHKRPPQISLGHILAQMLVLRGNHAAGQASNNLISSPSSPPPPFSPLPTQRQRVSADSLNIQLSLLHLYLQQLERLGTLVSCLAGRGEVGGGEARLSLVAMRRRGQGSSGLRSGGRGRGKTSVDSEDAG
jgi:hypothetical protein